MRGGPMIAALGPCTPAFERGAEIVDSKLRPEPRAPEQRCDGNRGEKGGSAMRGLHRAVVASSLLIAAVSFTAAVAGEPKHGGVLKIYHRDSPPSASIHEEATYSTVIPFMPLFNNLVMRSEEHTSELQSLRHL